MRNWMAAWTVGAVVMSGTAASAQDAAKPQPGLTVVAHVVDHAHLSAGEMSSAQRIAAETYRAVGLNLVWSSTPWMPRPDRDSESASIDIRLIILNREMAERHRRVAGMGEGALGSAASEAVVPAARIAYVFYDRIARVALINRVTTVLGLGQVMAHEIGHLLLGPNSHSEEGLMREGWYPRETQLKTFTASQVETIRRRFASTNAN